MKEFINEYELVKAYVISRDGHYNDNLSYNVEFHIYCRATARIFADAYELDNKKSIL